MAQKPHKKIREGGKKETRDKHQNRQRQDGEKKRQNPNWNSSPKRKGN